MINITYLDDWKKFETIGNARPISTPKMKTGQALIWSTRLAIKYCYRNTVYFAKQKGVMNVILGVSNQFILMRQLVFKVEQNQNK